MKESNTNNPQEPVTLSTTKKMIDELLNDFFMSRIKNAEIIGNSYKTLWRCTQDFALAGGKRLRPYVTLLTYQAFSGKKIGEALPVAAALELLHLGMLVHDDIIDRDYMRHGVLNISGQYEKLYDSFINNSFERKHHSNSAALLAGDLLLLGGHELLVDSSLTSDELRDVSRIYNKAVFIVAGGELLDTESAFRPFSSTDALVIARYKTAHYSFVTPLLMGAKLAGVSDKVCKQLELFGEQLGIGYQLVDDILGVFGDEAVTGKSNMNDLREGKHTYLIEQFMQRANDSDMATFNRLFGNASLKDSEATILRNLLTSSGAKKAVDYLIEQSNREALSLLKDIEIDEVYKKDFNILVKTALRREV